jgi:hypothetical protein
MYPQRDGVAKGGGSSLPPLSFGTEIKECTGCGSSATPEELDKGLCTDCRPRNCSSERGPLEGFDQLGLARCDEGLVASIRNAACRSIALDFERDPFEVSALRDHLALRGTVIA